MSTFRRRLMMYKKPQQPGGLPDTFQQIRYIESTGTQYIDTNYYLDSGCDVIVDFLPLNTTSTDNYGMLVGYLHGSSYNDNFTCNIPVQKTGTTPTSPTLRYNGQSYIWSSDFCKTGDRYLISYGKSGLSLNGTSKTTFNTSSFTCGGKCYIFKANGSSIYLSLKLYSFKIVKNNVTQMELIPCYRKSDGEVGLYDIIGQTFLTNAGTGDFVAGYKLLPDIYQEVEYIESDGSGQYIHSDFSTNNFYINIDCNIQYVNITSTASQLAIWGSVGGGNWLGQNNKVYAIGGSGQRTTTSSMVRKEVYGSINSSGSNMTVDNDSVSRTGTHNNNGYYSIFYGNGTYNSKLKVYEVRFYNNATSELIAHFVPCYRKADTEIGLYDVVNDKFYTNDGSGSFTKGDDVIDS